MRKLILSFYLFLNSIPLFSQTKKMPPAPVVIYGEIMGLDDNDNINIIHWDNYLDVDSNQPPVFKSQMDLNIGEFFLGTAGSKTFNYQIQLPNETGIFSIYTEKSNLIDRFFISPGDTILIMVDFKKASINFAGPSAIRMKVQQEIRAAHETYLKQFPPIMITGNKENFFASGNNLLEYSNAKLNSNFKKLEILDYSDDDIPILEKFFTHKEDSHLGWLILEGYKNNLSSEFVDLLKIDLQARIQLDKIKLFSSTFKLTETKIDFYHNRIKNSLLTDLDNPIALSSPSFVDLIFEYSTLKAIIEKQPIFDLYNTFTEGLRDLLMGKYLAKYHNRISNPEPKFIEALDSINTPWIHDIVNNIYNSQKIGTQLISTSLFDKNKKEVALEDLHGKILLIDYWFTGCGACASKYKNYLSIIERHFLNEKSFTILSVNTDRKMDTWLKSIKTNIYTSPNNTNLWTGGTDHEILKHYNIVSYPTLMLVDKEGKIALMGDFPKDVNEMIKLIEKLIEI